MPIEPLRRARWERHLGSACSGLGLLVDSMAHLKHAVRVLGWPMPRTRARLLVSLLGQVLRQTVHRLAGRAIVGSGKQERDRYREAARAYELLMPISYYVTGDLPQILYATVRNLNVAELAGPSAELALAYANAHATTALIPLLSLARAYGVLARNALEGLDDRLVESWVYVMNGVYFTGVGQFDEAIACSDRIVRIANEIRFPRRLEEGWALYGTTCLLRGNLVEAAAGYEKLRASAERGDPQTLNWGLVGLAHVAVCRGDAEEGRRLGEEGERLLAKNLGRPERIYTYGTLALAYLRCGDVLRARETADRAADWIARGAPVAFYNIHSYAAVAEVYLDLWARAAGTEKVELRVRLRQALRQIHNCGRVFPVGRPREWYWRGQTESRAGRTKQALRSWQRALRLADQHGWPADVALAESAIGTQRTGA
jgi:tetratricopeptide (TPR) repeat protein